MMDAPLSRQDRRFLLWRGALWGGGAALMAPLTFAVLGAVSQGGLELLVGTVIMAVPALIVGVAVGLALAAWGGWALVRGRSLVRIMVTAAVVALAATTLTIAVSLLVLTGDLTHFAPGPFAAMVAFILLLCVPALVLALLGVWLTLRTLRQRREPRLD